MKRTLLTWFFYAAEVKSSVKVEWSGTWTRTFGSLESGLLLRHRELSACRQAEKELDKKIPLAKVPLLETSKMVEENPRMKPFECQVFVSSRLLCVEPNRRMTIDEFLEHGWIQNDNIPDTVLFTPKIIANDVSSPRNFENLAWNWWHRKYCKKQTLVKDLFTLCRKRSFTSVWLYQTPQVFFRFSHFAL